MTKTLSVIISDEDAAKMSKLLDAETENFIELMEMVGIDPKTELRFANLEGSDFTDCDLRGFDFTGCDLRNTKGKNTVWDSTTILTNAQIENSIFAGGQP